MAGSDLLSALDIVALDPLVSPSSFGCGAQVAVARAIRPTALDRSRGLDQKTAPHPSRGFKPSRADVA
jgi:hypothetical protein